MIALNHIVPYFLPLMRKGMPQKKIQNQHQLETIFPLDQSMKKKNNQGDQNYSDITSAQTVLKQQMNLPPLHMFPPLPPFTVTQPNQSPCQTGGRKLDQVEGQPYHQTTEHRSQLYPSLLQKHLKKQPQIGLMCQSWLLNLPSPNLTVIVTLQTIILRKPPSLSGCTESISISNESSK